MESSGGNSEDSSFVRSETKGNGVLGRDVI